MNDAQRKAFEETHECDFSFEMGTVARFRVNVFMQRKGEGAVFRTIPTKILTLEQLEMPAILKQLCEKGKRADSSYRSYGFRQVDHLSRHGGLSKRDLRRAYLTVEDPIEFVHQSKSVSLTSASWDPTQIHSPTRCARRCVKIQTLFSSAKCAISKPFSSR